VNKFFVAKAAVFADDWLGSKENTQAPLFRGVFVVTMK
jgi:hypothetical protein